MQVILRGFGKTQLFEIVAQTFVDLHPSFEIQSFTASFEPAVQIVDECVYSGLC